MYGDDERKDFRFTDSGRKITSVNKREIWSSFSEDTQEFISAWPKGSIVGLTNINKQLIWRKLDIDQEHHKSLMV